jgi:hypothetical protein
VIGVAACCGTIACAEPTTPVLQPTLDDALFHVQLADPLSAVGATELGLPIVIPQIRRIPDCAFDASAERFDCPSRTAGGVTVDRFYVLTDDAGRAQREWSDRVVAVRLVTDISGVDGTTPIRSHDEATLTGLRSPQQLLGGVATMSWTRDGDTRTVTRMTDLVILSRAMMPGIFPSGSITLEATSVGVRSMVALSYDGTSIVAMLSTAGGGRAGLVCSYDLLKPEQPKRCEG